MSQALIKTDCVYVPHNPKLDKAVFFSPLFSSLIHKRCSFHNQDIF